MSNLKRLTKLSFLKQKTRSANGTLAKDLDGTKFPLKVADETKFQLKSSGHNVNLKTQGYTIGGRLRLVIMTKLKHKGKNPKCQWHLGRFRSDRSGNNFNSTSTDHNVKIDLLTPTGPTRSQPKTGIFKSKKG